MIAHARKPAPENSFGAGLQPAHYRDALSPNRVREWAGDAQAPFDFFEIHAENYMCEGGPPHAWLSAIAEKYPLSFHGVCLSLGGMDDLDTNHLTRLKKLVDRYDPVLVSEHIAWSAHDGVHFHDLLAPPLSEESLRRTARHIMQVQDILGRQILVENPSRYLAMGGEMDEPEFLNALVRDTGCALLLDINNVYVSAANVGFSAAAYIDAIDARSVGEIHLAGHSRDHATAHEFLIDDHSGPVCDAVGALYQRFLERAGPRPTLFEWDTEPPALAEIARETLKIRRWAEATLMQDAKTLAAHHG